MSKHLDMNGVRQRCNQTGKHMTQGEFRAKLGWDLHRFTVALTQESFPAPLFKLDNGERIFDRAAAEAYCRAVKP